MPLKSTLPLRLDPEVDTELQRLAGVLGCSKSALARRVLKYFVEQCVGLDGSITMPPQFIPPAWD